MTDQLAQNGSGVLGWIDRDITGPMRDFQDPHKEWRRLFSELYGTFLLVIVAAGGGMMSQAFPNTISRTAAVVAPALMVLGIILFMGKVSGAHLNPAVSVAFALRGDFPWRRVPGYIIVQLIGATLAALLLHGVIDVSAEFGSNYVASGYSGGQGYLMEALLTMGLVSVILGTASGAQNIGIFGAIGVGSYIALAGLWGSPISGASMNPARTFGPDLVSSKFTDYWVYIAGPLTGALIAVGLAYVLRGAGGGRSGSAAAQGDLLTQDRRRPDASIGAVSTPLDGLERTSANGTDVRRPLRPRDVALVLAITAAAAFRDRSPRRGTTRPGRSRRRGRLDGVRADKIDGSLRARRKRGRPAA